MHIRANDCVGQKNAAQSRRGDGQGNRRPWSRRPIRVRLIVKKLKAHHPDMPIEKL